MLDQALGSCRERIADIRAAAAIAKGHWCPRDELPVEPGRAIGTDLAREIEVRPHREREAFLAGRVGKAQQFDDRAKTYHRLAEPESVERFYITA